MGLKSQLFTLPKPDPRLERCLVDDAGHITQGSRGDHVKKIQSNRSRVEQAGFPGDFR